MLMLSFLGLGVLAGGCSLEDESPGKGCAPLVAAPSGGIGWSMFVDLVDEKGQPVCRAKVTARDGEFEQVLVNSNGTFMLDACNSFPMPDRYGTYELTVEVAGFRTKVVPGVELASASRGCMGPEIVRVQMEHEAAR
jgi:hypothetical protein